MRDKLSELIREHGKVINFDAPFKKEDGSSIWVQFSGIQPSEEDFFEGGATGITDRKRAEEALEKRLKYERMLRDISEKSTSFDDINKFQDESLQVIGEALDISRAYIFKHNHRDDTTDNAFEWCAAGISPQKYALQGIPAGDIQWWIDKLGNNETIIYKDIEDIPSKQVKEILRPQGIKSILVVPLFDKGKYFGFMGFDECRYHRDWFEEDVGILKSTVQIIVGAIERKHGEDALKDNEKKFKDLFQNAQVALFRTRISDGKLIEINERFAHMAGYSNCGDCMAEFNAADAWADPTARSEMLKILQENGSVQDYETEIIRKNGTHLWILFSATIVPEQGFLEGSIVDISDRKILETQLQQAYKMEAIGTLAGGIAHDFNNILTPIIVQSELALMDLEEKNPVRFNLQEVMKAGLRAKDLVKQILTFSRQSEQQPIPLKVTPIIKEATKLLRASLPTTIDITHNFQKDEDTVTADPTRIHQVLMNLSTNAAHAMRDKGGVLSISLGSVVLDAEDASGHADLESGPYLKLSVSDTGHGIPPEAMDRIFDPFFTTKDRAEGTGMGLAVVHGIIKSYGGEITVDSELEVGTTFNVFFPAIKDEVSFKPEVTQQLPSGNEHVLIVDDEKIMVETLGRMLDRLGYKVTSRTSSLEALELFRKKQDQFDLVITDMTMPQMTGDEFAKHLMEIRPGIPIILCTGYSERVSELTAKGIGIKAFVMKPIVMSDIAHTIREVLDEK